MVCDWKSYASWSFYGNGAYQKDYPIQGKPDNCTLIAALSALAWAKPDLIAQNQIPNGYQVIYYDLNLLSHPVCVTKELLFDDSIDEFCWAHSSISNAIWPGIYEKAYAQFRIWMNSQENTDLGCETSPIAGTGWNADGSNINWGGNSLNVLIYCTGATSKYDNVTSAFITPYKCFEDVMKNNASSYIVKVGSLYQYKTRYPSVAWTKPGATGGCVDDNHAYAILGVMWDRTNSDINNYIVLRHTYETCAPPAPPVATFGNIIPLNGTAGAFAISAKDFTTNFEAYGWVKP